MKNGLYFCKNTIDSITILEVLEHNGETVVARCGRNTLTPLIAYEGCEWIGPLVMPEPHEFYTTSELRERNYTQEDLDDEDWSEEAEIARLCEKDD
jgi:hypothetical protein